MEQPITDYVGFLNEAKQAVIELAKMQDQEDVLEQRVRQSKKELEAEEKAVADAIVQIIKKRTEEIQDSYDKELGKGQDRLKKARSKREKAKTQGVKERIGEETAALREENRQLNLQIKTLFRQNSVPGYCNSSLYYALYVPRRAGEFLKLLLVIGVCFLVIPYGGYLLIPNRTALHLMVIYLLCIVVFGGIYVITGNKTKVAHDKPLKEGRLIRDQMHSNNKKIKVITQTIRKDKNEAIYDLQKHDDTIAQAEQELAEIADRKKEALNTFETVTKNILSDEITDNNKDKIAHLRSIYETVEQELRESTNAVKTKTLYITDHYESYLGREFLKPQRLEVLCSMIRDGSCSNLSEAITEYNNKHA